MPATDVASTGACGKPAATAELQDLLIYTLKGLGAWAAEARGLGLDLDEVDDAIMTGLFATITKRCCDKIRSWRR